MANATLIHATGFIADPMPVYFERFGPPLPLVRPTVVMIHGGGHTGSCYQMTADGRPGWAYRFAARGWNAVVPDWPGHGRSGAPDLAHLTGEDVCEGLAALLADIGGPILLLTHSMGGALGWRVAELAASQVVGIVGIAPGPPGNIQPAAEVTGETAEDILIQTPQRRGRISKQASTRSDREFVEDKLVGTSARFPRAHLAAYGKMLTPTASRLLYERQNTLGSQVRVQDPGCFAGKPVLIVTGDQDRDHPREIDEPIADWLAGHGALTQFVWLADRGITGNGHMLMMEENSDEIADLVIDWAARNFATQ
jgi:pimeloyl-ACP methyl ester carboxylesterase